MERAGDPKGLCRAGDEGRITPWGGEEGAARVAPCGSAPGTVSPMSPSPPAPIPWCHADAAPAPRHPACAGAGDLFPPITGPLFPLAEPGFN